MSFLLFEVKRKETEEYLKRLYEQGKGDEYILSFSSLNKYGINVSPYDKTTPLGVYGYLLKSLFQNYGGEIRKLPFAADRPYILVLKIKPDARILVVSKITSSNVEELFQYLHDHANESLRQRLKDFYSSLSYKSSFLPYKRFFHLLYNYAPIVFAKSPFHDKRYILTRNILTDLGYDIVIDDGTGIIHENEPHQVIILNLSKAEHVGTLYNPYATVEPKDEKNYRLIYYQRKYSDLINVFIFAVLRQRLNLDNEKVRHNLISFLKTLYPSMTTENAESFFSEIKPIIKKIYNRYDEQNYNPIEAVMKHLPTFRFELKDLSKKYNLGSVSLDKIQSLVYNYIMNRNLKKYIDLFTVNAKENPYLLVDLITISVRNQMDETSISKLATLIYENYDHIHWRVSLPIMITILKLSKNTTHHDLANSIIEKHAELPSFSVEVIDELINIFRSKQTTIDKFSSIIDEFLDSSQLRELITEIKNAYRAGKFSDKKQLLQLIVEKLKFFVDVITGDILSQNEKDLLIKTAAKKLLYELNQK